MTPPVMRCAAGETQLQRLLTEKAMSHYELAARSGVSRSFITRVANGSRQPKELPPLVAIAWVLEVPIEALSEHLAGINRLSPLGPRPNPLPTRMEQFA